MQKKSMPLISVLMLTYNHEQYIAQAIESVLAQNTEYPFELIICDDASADRTQEIAREYAEKDPRIVLSFQPRNTKFGKNFADGCGLIRGKYVAFCEGDDYWTSPDKLNTQVGFLENNPDFSVCAHKVQILDQISLQPDDKPQYVYKDCMYDEDRIKNGVFYADEAIANYYFQTGSLVLRWRFRDGLPDWFRLRMMFDHFMFMLHAVEGKIKYFDTPMSVWRRHGGGYTWLQTRDKGLFFQKEGDDWIKMYYNMDKFFSYRFTWQIRERILLAIRSIAANCIETGNMDQLADLVDSYPRYFDQIKKDSVLYEALSLVYPDNIQFQPPWQSVSPNPDAVPGLEEKSAPASGRNDTHKKQYGGFFELAIEDIPEVSGNIWDAWTHNQEYARFFNLRSALFRYLWQHGVSTVWLPAYSPPLLEMDRNKCQFTRKFYRISQELTPHMDFIKNVQPGEAVLTIRYLGRPLPREFCEALGMRKDIVWVEDMAQCLTGTPDPQASAAIYSPRKLLGVPDGGLLVGNDVHKYEDWLSAPEEGVMAERMRMLSGKYEFPDTYGGNSANLSWQKNELENHLSRSRMSRETEALLKRVPLEYISEKRKNNWAALYSKLADYCLWNLPRPDFAPFAFPFLVPRGYPAEILHTMLARQEMFCQRMWYPLPLQKNQFPIEQNLSERLVLLPCDQRFTPDDMLKIADKTLDVFNRPESFTNCDGLDISG